MRGTSTTLLIALGLVAVIIAALGTLFLTDPAGFAETLPQMAEVGAFVVLLVVAGLGLWSTGAFGQAVRHSLTWVVVGGLAFGVYAQRDQIEWMARRMIAELSPPVAAVERVSGEAGDRVVVERVRGTQFRIPVDINAAEVTMLVDTGASVVTLTHDDALAAGVNLDKLDYSAVIYTANGRTTAAPVILDAVAVGSIERKKVPALVARAGALERSLLGLSFLDTLASYSISGDKLELAP